MPATPAGTRHLQMQTAAVSPQPEREDEKPGKSQRHDALDVLSDDLLALMASKHLLSRGLAQGLNARGQYPTWSHDVLSSADERGVTPALIAAILTHLDTPQAWSLQRRYQHQWLALSRLIGILHGLPKKYVDGLAASSYLLDVYTVDAWHLLMSRISGSTIRWAQKFGSPATREQLVCALEQLEAGQAGTAVTLCNVAGAGSEVHLAVRITYETSH